MAIWFCIFQLGKKVFIFSTYKIHSVGSKNAFLYSAGLFILWWNNFIGKFCLVLFFFSCKNCDMYWRQRSNGCYIRYVLLNARKYCFGRFMLRIVFERQVMMTEWWKQIDELKHFISISFFYFCEASKALRKVEPEGFVLNILHEYDSPKHFPIWY